MRNLHYFLQSLLVACGLAFGAAAALSGDRSVIVHRPNADAENLSALHNHLFEPLRECIVGAYVKAYGSDQKKMKERGPAAFTPFGVDCILASLEKPAQKATLDQILAILAAHPAWKGRVLSIAGKNDKEEVDLDVYSKVDQRLKKK